MSEQRMKPVDLRSPISFGVYTTVWLFQTRLRLHGTNRHVVEFVKTVGAGVACSLCHADWVRFNR